MLSFESDYNNGAHPLILRKLVETNDLQSLTYGFDQWSESAREKIRIATECPHASVFFLTGGTQTNMTVIDGSEVTLPWLSQHCDVFYIGGTKVGALCGEAVVFPRGNAPKHFFNIIKRHGALSAKGRTIGIQFDTLFTDNLYFNIAKHAITMAMRLKKTLQNKGYKFFIDSPTNQQFVVLPNDKIEQLSQKVEFTIWEPFDEKSKVCRFVTSWATTEEQMKELEMWV